VTDNSQLSSLVKPSDYGYVTEPFNTNNLYTPASALPASVYDQQPQCWTYTGTAPLCIPEVQEPGCVSSYTCSQTAPYEPLIAVPVEITALDPSWANCTAWYGGLSGMSSEQIALLLGHECLADAPILVQQPLCLLYSHPLPSRRRPLPMSQRQVRSPRLGLLSAALPKLLLPKTVQPTRE